MLPKSRILAALAIGLGACLIAAGLLASRVLPQDARMPLTLEHTTFTLRDENATSWALSAQREVQGPVVRQLHYQVLPPTSDTLATLHVGLTDMRESLQDELDRLITASTWAVSVDRRSGELVAPAKVNDQLASPTKDVDVHGMWLKFPSDAQKTNYPVFDPTIRDSRDATFVEEAEVEGRMVYRYRQTVEPVNVATRYHGALNTMSLPEPAAPEAPADEEPAEGEPQAPAMVTTYLTHSATRTFTVDQVTGMIVNIEEEVDDYYATAAGERRAQALRFHGALSDDDVHSLIEQAKHVPTATPWKITAGIALALGALLALGGLVIAFRRPRRRTTVTASR